MRIALVSQEYPPETAKGGIGTQTYLKAHGLASLGHEVHVISRSPSAERSERRDHAVRVSRIPGVAHRLPIYTEPADWLTYSAEVAAALASLQAAAPFDVVDFPEWGAEGYVHLLNRTEWNHVPAVIHLHGPLVMLAHTVGWPEINSEFYRTGTAMEGTCLRLADAVFSSSRCSVEWCATHYGLEAKRVPILHTGVDTQHFAPRVLPKEDRPTVVFVGRITRHKGVVHLTEAACALARERPDLQLRLLGRGDEKVVKELRKMAEAAGCPKLLDLPGFVAQEDLPAHLSRAHVFAAPSAYEGGPGFVYLEAMACGLPVIACTGSGAAEVVTHEQTGLLVPPNDVEALGTALRRLLSDLDASAALGQRARRYVLETADSQTCLRRLEAFYSAVARGGPVPV